MYFDTKPISLRFIGRSPRWEVQAAIADFPEVDRVEDNWPGSTFPGGIRDESLTTTVGEEDGAIEIETGRGLGRTGLIARAAEPTVPQDHPDRIPSDLEAWGQIEDGPKGSYRIPTARLQGSARVQR